MINHIGNFPNLDGIENGGLTGLSAQCLMDYAVELGQEKQNHLVFVPLPEVPLF